ncbi:MAG: CsgG/HfaB family protein, partial [Caldimicrobium sp.]
MKDLRHLIWGLIFIFLSFCLPSLLFAEEYAKDVKERTLKLPYCERPIGTITARSFKCKAGACQGGVIVIGGGYTIHASPQVMGDGLADMLITALAQTGCFKVVERMALAEIKEELELMGISPKGALKSADFIIVGAVTALELQASGLGGGGFVIPLPWKFGGGIKLGKSNAHIGVDMRIVRVRDGQILVAKTVEGKSERWHFGVAGGGLFGEVAGGGWISAVKNTPLEEATRDLIANAVTLIVNELKTQSPDVLVGERTIVYDEKGQIVREERQVPINQKVATFKEEATDKESKSKILATGELKRQTIGFSHYNKLLLQEDFSKCRLIPTTIKILRGQGECVEFGGKKWFATTRGEMLWEKEIPDLKSAKDFAVEYKIYFGKGGGAHWSWISLSLGK